MPHSLEPEQRSIRKLVRAAVPAQGIIWIFSAIALEL